MSIIKCLQTLPGIVLYGIIFFFFSCKKESDPNAYFDQFADSIVLSIESNYGGGQLVHPDLVYNSKTGKYFLVATPYPYSDDKYENPCIYFGETHFEFAENTSGQNPIVNTPKKGHNDDPDLYFDYSTKKFYLNYLETAAPDSQNLVLLKSDDATNWSKQSYLHYNFRKHETFIVSPSMLSIEDFFYLFYVNISVRPFRVEYLKSKIIGTWNKDSVNVTNTELPFGYYPWHIDVISNNGEYFLLCNGFLNDKYSLFLLKRDDVGNWQLCDVLDKYINFKLLKIKKLYRSTGIIKDKQLLLLFSFMSTGGVWKIGHVRINVAEYLN